MPILDHKRIRPLLECGTFASELIEALKLFARTHAYNSTPVLRVELQGSQVIHRLMDTMWESITERTTFEDLGSRRANPKAAFVYSKISDSYRWHFERVSRELKLPIRYREMQLLTDMISGMTDIAAMPRLGSQLNTFGDRSTSARTVRPGRGLRPSRHFG